jgi:hypothetical protein
MWYILHVLLLLYGVPHIKIHKKIIAGVIPRNPQLKAKVTLASLG